MPLIANYTLQHHCNTTQGDFNNITYEVVQGWATHCERDINKVFYNYFYSSLFLLEDYDTINDALGLAIDEARYLVKNENGLTPKTKNALTDAIILLKQLKQMVAKTKTEKQQQ